MTAGWRAHSRFAIFYAAYAAFLVLSLPRYGATWDVFYEFPRATAYLSHFLGEETPSGVSPWHRLSYSEAESQRFSMNPCLPSLIAASTGKLFFENLRILDHNDAYHLGLALLWLLFVPHFYLRLAELHGPRLALVATVLLTLAPRIVAHVPNNMKDVPALAFATAALLELAVALTRGRPRRIYLAALFVGCAVSSKFVAGILVVPGAFLVYLALRKGGLAPEARRAVVVPLLTVPIVSVVVLVAHWPYLWAPPALLWARCLEMLEAFGWRRGSGPSIYPFAMAAMTTPILVLAGLACAAVAAFRTRGAAPTVAGSPAEERAERALLLFYAVWMLAVLTAFSSGRIALFDGVRHFMLFLPPATVLAAWGILRASDGALARLRSRAIDDRWPKALLVPLVLVASIVPIARFHPYEIAYFNGLAGGLRGATGIRFGGNVLEFEPRDYWGTSVRAAVEWANENLPRRSSVWISVPPLFSEFEVYPLRPDMAYRAPPRRRKRKPHYLIFINRQKWMGRLERQALERGEIVHREEVQGVPLSFVVRISKPRKAKPPAAAG